MERKRIDVQTTNNIKNKPIYKNKQNNKSKQNKTWLHKNYTKN